MPVSILETVSNRADLVSGGDVLLRVRLPPSSAGVLSLNGTPVTNALHVAPDNDGFLALLTGLKFGPNVVTLTTGRRTSVLSVTNHPIGGPVFSGPHLNPWTCTTQSSGLGAPQDADCNAPTVYTFFYKKAGGTDFVAYDPVHPPLGVQIATATTDQGMTVPYIVRVETGTVNRSIYKITVLFDPAKSWTAWAPQAAWNRKVVYLFGAGSRTEYAQGTMADTFDDRSLSRGFATAAAGMTTHGRNANAKLNAEALMMVKEHVTEAYGPIRYTIGSGCSGGAIQQHSIGDQYPGLIDGFLPTCSYPDVWSQAVNFHDCHVLTRYFTMVSPALWTKVEDRLVVNGVNSEQECPGQDGPASFGGRSFVATNASCLLPAESLYDPIINPRGVRCTLRDYQVNVVGRRPDDVTNQIFDNVGVQYGLRGVQAGAITPEQFVDLNQKIGGLDSEGNYQPQRTRADVNGLERMYSSGLITYGRELGKYPIIDARSNDNHEDHNNSEWMFTRNRLIRANGSAANQVHWWEASTDPNPAGNTSPPSAPVALRAFNLMDQWLGAIEADRSAASHETKVSIHKPAEARDVCFVGGQQYEWTAGSVCDQQFTYTGMMRMVAGGPNTNDVLKCQLKPLSRADYSVTFTDGQWQRLQKVFAEGVCDYSKPGVGQQPPTAAWLTFMGGPGGTPLGAPPRAIDR